MADLFGRYWDSEERADKYAQGPSGDGIDDPFHRYNGVSEMEALIRCYDPEKLNLVLDAGCGAGRFLNSFPETAVRVGADASLNLLHQVKRRGWGDFLVCCELEHLPFKEGLFDTVISCRVLQHLEKQELAIREMARVTARRGDVILELYNSWNLKTVYKAIRMRPRLARTLNAPFTLIRKSWSPFAPWGLQYDRYNNWFETKRWLRRAGMRIVEGSGVGFGYHRYCFVPFSIHGILKRMAPRYLTSYYAGCLKIERTVGKYAPFKWTWEKFAIKATRAAVPQAVDIWSRLRGRIKQYACSMSMLNLDGLQERRRERDRTKLLVGDDQVHLTEAIEWLRRAQDANCDSGVARGYHMAWQSRRGAPGWQSSYPETTGYIIPTLFDCAVTIDDPDCAKRAIRMAEWEIAVQMSNGAVMGSTVEVEQRPAVFNTGQVLFGWLRVHAETGDERHLHAARRAGRFLVETLGSDGCWHQANSPFAESTSCTYNSRVGWAMILLGQRTGEEEFIESGVRNLRYSMSEQCDNGWFQRCCLNDVNAPLTHTLCYAIEGLIGGYQALGDRTFLERATLAAEAMASRIREDGSLPGRFDSRWNPRVEWSCLTGCAQLAVILLELDRINGNAAYGISTRKLLNFLKSTQNCTTQHPGLRGGIKGSHPFDGAYNPYTILSWATKFFIDALLLEAKRAPSMIRGASPSDHHREHEVN